MARITILSYDRVLDRRTLLQAQTLINAGHDVTVYAQAYSATENDPPYVTRVGTLPNAGVKHASMPRVFGWRNVLEQSFPRFFRQMLPFMRPLYWAMNGCNPARLYLALYNEAMQTMPKADIYIAHDLPMLPVACALKTRDNAKVIYDSHEYFCEQEFSRFEKRMWQKLEVQFIARADAVMTVNPSIASELSRIYGLPTVEVVYNAEDTSTPLAASMKRFHTMFGLADAAQIVLYQGGLSHGRNIDVLVRMVRFLAPHIHVVILGSGPQRNALAALSEHLGVESRVHMLDAVPQHALLTLTQEADVGVIPYRDTCLNYRYCTPNKLFEFIAAGLPVIATNLPEIVRIVGLHGIGRVGDTSDPQALAQMVHDVLEPVQHSTIKENVMRARQSVNWEQEGKHFLTIVERLI